MNNRFRLRVGLYYTILAIFSGCGSSAMNALNPFVPTDQGAQLGESNLAPLLEGGGEGSGADKARHALEVMGAQTRAQDPQPYYPVVKPSEVRLMWIPDHLNKHGDLVPAHYYYLKVLSDRWQVTDAFDMERQLDTTPKGGSGSGEGNGGATPWVYGEARSVR
jgi:hypothetical protein